MPSPESKSAPARFNVGDRVRVKDLPNLFYTRTQMYVRGVSGMNDTEDSLWVVSVR